MTDKSLRPSTMGGIKSLAKKLKAEHGWKHRRALEEACRIAGYQNTKHAQNVLGTGKITRQPQPRPVTHATYITAHWKDLGTGERGRETLCLQLAVPRLELMQVGDIAKHRAFDTFTNAAPDHLERSPLCRSQQSARDAVCAAARTLLFMQATRLRPSKSHSKVYPKGSSAYAIPGTDHPSTWYDPVSKGYIYVDEPYPGRVKDVGDARSKWAEEHDFDVVKIDWAGMYYPGYAELYLVSHRETGVPLAPIAAVLNDLPAPPTSATWTGESAPGFSVFMSPGAIAKGAETKEKTKAHTKPRSGPLNSVGYTRMFVGPDRRPATRMPIRVHTEIAQLLGGVLADSHYRPGVYNRVDMVRSDLDEWVQREYTAHELPSDQFHDLYYRHVPGTYKRRIEPAAQDRHLQNLEKAKILLRQHYPECAPLRAMIRNLDYAVASMQAWG